MLSVNVLNTSYFRKNIVNQFFTASIKKTCSRRFHYEKNARDKFQKLTFGIGCTVGISVLYGITSFRKQAENEYSIISEMLRYKNKLYAASLPNQQKGTVSPRSYFNFFADVAEKTRNTVVYIEIIARHPYTLEQIPVSSGSGFIVKKDGLILTNAHVVNNFGQVIVKLCDGKSYCGIVEDIDTESDLATVRIKAKNLPVLALGCSSDVRPGEFVIALGNPLALSHTITAGVVSSTSRQGIELGLHEKCNYIQTDAAIHIGNSGGPLVNLDGEAIGINTLKVTEGISFAIPSDHAIEFLKRSEEKAKAGHWTFFQKSGEQRKHKFLGIAMLTLSPAVIKELKGRNPDFPSVDHGVLVWRVMVGSPSYEAGIRPGDVICQINNLEVTTTDIIENFLKKEDTLNVMLKRNQKTLEMTVSLFEPIMP